MILNLAVIYLATGLGYAGGNYQALKIEEAVAGRGPVSFRKQWLGLMVDSLLWPYEFWFWSLR